jgi:hypothetical protein
MMLGNALGWVKIVHFGESFNLLFPGTYPIASSHPIAPSYRMAGTTPVENNQIACYIGSKIRLH